jgi:hypothetical protein
MSVNSKLTAIADAIRAKDGSTAPLTLDGMADAIMALQTFNTMGLPEYWLNHLSAKADECNTALSEAGSDAVAFWFFTDSHNKYNSGYTGKLLRYMANATGVRRVINGGDILDYQNSQAEVTALFDGFTSDVVNHFPDMMLAAGNHDRNPYGTPVLTDAQYYEQFFSHMAQHGANGKTYYYVDDDALKVRFMVVDSRETSIAYSISNGDATEKAYAQEEVRWIYDTLNSTTQGYTVVAISHVMWWGASQFPQGSAIIGSSSMSQLCTVLNAYNKRQSGTEWGIAYNFANAKGTASYVQTGHTHIDYSQVISGVLTVSTAADSYHYANKRPDNIEHTLGTTTENALDLVIVKPSAGTVKTIRIGAGSNRLFNYSGTVGQVCKVTNNLTDCTTSNSAATATGSYSATLTASGGKTFLVSPTLFVHGYDLTANYVTVSADRKTAIISLPNVPGDIEIVAACGSIACTGVTLSKISHSGFEGDSFTLIATVTPSDTTDGLAWSTSNAAVATVSGGVVQLIGTGSATITATCGSKSASCAVTVAAVPKYTNLVPSSIAWLESGVYNGVGYKDGVYYSSSSLNGDSAYTSTGLIKMHADGNGGTPVMYLKGCTITTESHCRLTLFDSSKTKKTQINGFLTNTTAATVTELGTNYYKIQLADMGNYGFDNSDFYVSFSVKGSGVNLVVTAGEEIS